MERYARERDPALRDELVRRYLPLAQRVARRYGRGGDRDDLVQVASLGLVKAIDRFDPGRGVAFASFALPTMTGELKRHFRDTDWALRVPRELQELSLRLDQAVGVLTSERGRAPSPAVLAAYLRVSVEDVLEGLQVASAHGADWLDERAAEGSPTLGEQVAIEEPGFERSEHSATLDGLMRELAPRARGVAAALRR